MRDELLSIGSTFDWISPLLAFAQSLAKGPSYTFLVPWNCGWSGREVARLLKDHGIESWGHMVVDRTLMLSVRQKQAHWAQVVLDQAGVPVENPLAHPVRRGSSRHGDAIGEFLDLRIL